MLKEEALERSERALNEALLQKLSLGKALEESIEQARRNKTERK